MLFLNDSEVESPEDFEVIPGATYIIASPDEALDPNDMIVTEEDGAN